VSPTQLTLRKLRKDGWPLVRVVEKWNPFARIRQDLFGFDVIAIRGDKMLWVQATSASNVSARVAKLKANPDVPILLGCSQAMRGVVWGWAKNKSGRYELKRAVELEMSEGWVFS
jgi:hypothetical protein